jgi:hypothetical protein
MEKLPKRSTDAPIAISIGMVIGMLVMMSYAHGSVVAWIGFALTLVGLVLVNRSYRALLRVAAGTEEGTVEGERRQLA